LPPLTPPLPLLQLTAHCRADLDVDCGTQGTARYLGPEYPERKGTLRRIIQWTCGLVDSRHSQRNRRYLQRGSTCSTAVDILNLIRKGAVAMRPLATSLR